MRKAWLKERVLHVNTLALNPPTFKARRARCLELVDDIVMRREMCDFDVHASSYRPSLRSLYGCHVALRLLSSESFASPEKSKPSTSDQDG